MAQQTTPRKADIFNQAADRFERDGQPVTALLFRNIAWEAQQERNEFTELLSIAKAQHERQNEFGSDPSYRSFDL